MGTGLPITVGIGLVVSLGLLGYSVWSGKSPAKRPWAWILGLILLGVSLVPRTLLMFATGIESGDWENSVPIAIGTIALAAVLIAAIWRPVWAGWCLLASAAVIPALLWVMQVLVGEVRDNVIPAVALLATYSLPVVVISVLLVLSGSKETDAPARDREIPVATSDAGVR